MSMIADFSDVPCEIHKPHKLGHCGCNPLMADREYLEKESAKAAEDFGRRMRLRHETQVMKAIFPDFTWEDAYERLERKRLA